MEEDCLRRICDWWTSHESETRCEVKLVVLEARLYGQRATELLGPESLRMLRGLLR